MAQISMSEVRQRFPQYSDVSDEQLLEALRRKHYADIPPDQFNKMVVRDRTPSAPVAETPKPPGMLSGLAQQFNQGISLGGADELMAGAERLAGGDYRGSLDRQRREREAFQAKNPYLSAGATALGAVAPVAMATIAGTVAAPGPGTVAGAATSGARALQLTREALYGGGNALRSVNTAGQALREGARAGYTPGVVAGALTADPDDRLQGAAIGGAAGVALGGAVGGGMQGLGNLSARATPYLERVANAVGAGRSGMSWAVPPAPGGGGAQAPITSAEMKILQAMEAGGVSPDLAAARLAQARQRGVPLGLVDVGGQPVQRLARGVRTLPGEGSAIIDDALQSRAVAQPDRVINFLERAVGRTSTGNAGGRADALITQARNESAPFYGRLDSLPPLNDYASKAPFQVPRVRDIVQGSESARRNWGVSVDPLYNDAGTLRRPPTFRDVDRVKQNIDELLLPQYQQGPRPADSVSIGTREERSMADALRRQLLTAADAAPGGSTYATARASFAGPAQARDALEQGREFPRATLVDVQARRQGGTPAENKWYQRGVMEALRERVEGMPDLASQPNVVRAVAGSRGARAKLEAAVPDRRVQALRDRLTMENQGAQTNAFVRSGSQTADKTVEAADTAVDLAADAISGTGFFPMAARAVRGGYEKLIAGANAETRAQVARNLTSFNDPAAQQEFLRRLQQLQASGNLNARQVDAVARSMTISTQAE